MKRSVLSLFLILALLTAPLSALAEAADAYEAAMAGTVGNVEDFYVEYIGEAAIGIQKYSGSEANLILPEVEVLSATVNTGGMDLECRTIASEAFIYNNALKTLVVPEGYQYIRYRTFYGCENLTTVVLPSTLISIDCEAFAQCASLTNVIFPKGSHVQYIDETAFDGCTQMTMTEEEITALIDTTVQEEMQAKAEQQAAFVVDEDAMVELAGYLATDMDDFGEMMRARKWRDSDRWGYAIDELTTTSIYSWNYIEEMELRLKCNYSLCGVYVSMDVKEARTLLLKSGWKLENQGSEHLMFIDSRENYLGCDYDADGAITSVNLVLNMNTVDELMEGTYDGSPVVQIPGDETAEASSAEADAAGTSGTVAARTTSDVNLRSGAGTGCDALCVVPAGATVEYLGESATDDRGVAWYHIRYEGSTGWCSSKYVELP